MLARRETARSMKDFKEADRIRGDIEHCGYRVEDGPEGQVLTKRTL
jgi:cysteinyl-tRNA synthetase